jgi:putative redox protein
MVVIKALQHLAILWRKDSFPLLLCKIDYMVRIVLERESAEYGFEAKDASGNVARFDNSPDDGGQDFGVRPMQSLLMALGSCSGIDVVSILKKKRQQLDRYAMIIEGEREKD